MYVYEEIIEGKKLTEIINETHENVKYLPGHKIPENVVSTFEFSDNPRIDCCDENNIFPCHQRIIGIWI